VVDINERWRGKGRTPGASQLLTFEATHERLFKAGVDMSKVGATEKVKVVNLDRSQRLREIDQRGRQFNILNGQDEAHHKWMVPLQREQAKLVE
jgi:hypothetical protein